MLLSLSLSCEFASNFKAAERAEAAAAAAGLQRQRQRRRRSVVYSDSRSRRRRRRRRRSLLAQSKVTFWLYVDRISYTLSVGEVSSQFQIRISKETEKKEKHF